MFTGMQWRSWCRQMQRHQHFPQHEGWHCISWHPLCFLASAGWMVWKIIMLLFPGMYSQVPAVKSSGVYGCCKRCFWHELEGTIAVGKHPLRWIRRNRFNSRCYRDFRSFLRRHCFQPCCTQEPWLQAKLSQPREMALKSFDQSCTMG